MSMALENYFAALKLERGVSNFALVQDRAIRRTSRPTPKQNSAQRTLKDALTRTSATKFSMDECDEPLFCPTRQISSDFSSQSLSADDLEALMNLSSDSLEALVNIDDSYRTPSPDKVNVALDKTADSRWSSAELRKQNDYLVHSRLASNIRAQPWRGGAFPSSA
ncbi:unnamed protein product [Cylindrotheca closterium]|uniref:Uncharacterized protein n=1 Tax=Cylindrotheca closterium TaxID=2856 RepID=A0AAD2CXP9_9STRA|nr:unnamed protein product [Cylindrotheca closterium]